MRIFYAIDFDEKTKREIRHVAKDISNILKAGRMIDPFNYHVTLEYIGEIENGKLDRYIIVLQRALINSKRADLVFKSISSFIKDKKQLIYLKVEDNSEVERARVDILRELKIKEKPFSPHITLFRDAIFKEGLSIDAISDIIGFKEIKYRVNEISIMESKKINGKIVYIDLYDQCLEGVDNGS